MDKKAGNDHNSGRKPSNQRYRRRKLTDFGAVTRRHYDIYACQLQPVKSRSIHIERLEKLHTFVNKGYLWSLKVNLLQNTDPLNQINKGRSPSNGKLSDFSFYIDSQKSAHRKFKGLMTQKINFSILFDLVIK